MSFWTAGALGVVLTITAVYIAHVKRGGSGMHRASPVVIAIALLTVAVNELLVIPTWGVEVGTRVISALFWCIIIPVTAYLSSKRLK